MRRSGRVTGMEDVDYDELMVRAREIILSQPLRRTKPEPVSETALGFGNENQSENKNVSRQSDENSSVSRAVVGREQR